MASKNVVSAYSLLTERCNSMMESKFIMSSNCIVAILKVVASIPCLTNYVVKCSQNFSFDQEFEKAASSSKFCLPSSNLDKVAFITSLLYKFDRKEIDLTKFIKVYFPSNDFENSYRMFCQDIIAPYLIAFNGILKEEDEVKPIVVDDNISLIDAIKNQVVQYITGLISIVSDDDMLKDEKKSDYLEVLNGFYYAFELNNVKMIKVVWIGLKSLLANYRLANSYMQAIEKILSQYAVL